jgi:hypothetical protein
LAFIICHEFVCHSRPPCFVALPQSSSLVFKVIEGPSLPLARPHEEVAAICGLEKISCVSEFHVSILMKKVVKPIGLSSYLECWPIKNGYQDVPSRKLDDTQLHMLQNGLSQDSDGLTGKKSSTQDTPRHAKTLKFPSSSRATPGSTNTLPAGRLNCWILGTWHISGDSLYMFPSFFWRETKGPRLEMKSDRPLLIYPTVWLKTKKLETTN